MYRFPHENGTGNPANTCHLCIFLPRAVHVNECRSAQASDVNRAHGDGYVRPSFIGTGAILLEHCAAELKHCGITAEVLLKCCRTAVETLLKHC